MTTDHEIDHALGHLRAYEGSPWPLERLKALRQAFELYAAENVAEARRHRATWDEVADAMGTSRQRAARVYRDDVQA